MIYFLGEDLEIFPFIFVPKLSPQVLDDKLAVYVLDVQFAHSYLLLFGPL